MKLKRVCGGGEGRGESTGNFGHDLREIEPEGLMVRIIADNFDFTS